MASKDPKRVKAGKKAAKTRKRNRRLGLAGPGQSKLVREAVPPIAIIVGAASGNMLTNLVNKGWKVEKYDDPEGKKTNFRRLIGPAVVMLVGAGTAIAGASMKDKESATALLVKNLGIGFVAGGMIKGINLFVKKELLEGIGATEKEQLEILEETEEEIKTLLEQNEDFKPDLPALNEGGSENLNPDNLNPEELLRGSTAFSTDLYEDSDDATVL